MNKCIDDLKLSEFVRKYPMIASKPQLLPMIAHFMALNPDGYHVRLYDGKISILKGDL